MSDDTGTRDVVAIATLGTFGNVLSLSATQELGGIGNQVIVSPAEDTGADTLSPRDVTAVEIEGNRYRVVAVLAESDAISPIQPDDAVVRPEGEFVQEGYSQVVVQADSGEDARVVAGVAIFNVVLTSTRERRGEIGVRRAVGVQRGDVLRTLVVEAALLGVLGGLLGAVPSALAAVGLGYFTRVEFDVVFDPSNGGFLVLAFVFGVFVALASGLYPA